MSIRIISRIVRFNRLSGFFPVLISGLVICLSMSIELVP